MYLCKPLPYLPLSEKLCLKYLLCLLQLHFSGLTCSQATHDMKDDLFQTLLYRFSQPLLAVCQAFSHMASKVNNQLMKAEHLSPFKLMNKCINRLFVYGLYWG